ncbi:hypothetical protein C6Y14_39050 [Streptomyces dioscori]|uniref:Uncharacterized protein n=1 Tax=Streptomyces dioscori TaxID=2109333 RepID=A0A2P8PVR2_9ACTN|nr:hypothetical protein [Streptomyces dioscori]PSM38079.1 hypothetical protein C6Y14_39050 [Streptomyces dioscori]
MNLHDVALRLPDTAEVLDRCGSLAVLHAILQPDPARRGCTLTAAQEGTQAARLLHPDGRWLSVGFSGAEAEAEAGTAGGTGGGALLHWHQVPGKGRPGVLDDVPKSLWRILEDVSCDCLGDPRLMAAAIWREPGDDTWRATDDSAPGAAPSLLRCLTGRSPERARRFAFKHYGTRAGREAVHHLMALRTDRGPGPGASAGTASAAPTAGPAARAFPAAGRLPSPATLRRSSELFRRRDASGLITTAAFRHRAGHDQQHFTDLAAEVDGDMVAIGGGATAVDAPQGALLTASYPADDGSAWLASSKDHNIPQPHRLTAFAIGMRIDGVSRDRLAGELLTVVRNRSRHAAHPFASARVPEGHTLIGGGFRVNWRDPRGGHTEGNLATASFPRAGGAWTARSKDHRVSSPCTIDAYAVCLKSSFVVDGVRYTVDVRTDFAESDGGPVPHPSAVLPLPASGHVLTGIGAEALPTEPGSLLWQLEPTADGTGPGVRSGSKDHGEWSPDTLCAWVLGIRLIRS